MTEPEPRNLDQPVELAPAPPEPSPDSFRSDIPPEPEPTRTPEPLQWKTWEEAGRPRARIVDGIVLERGWPRQARQDGAKFVPILKGQILINHRRRQKMQLRRQLPVGISKKGRDGKYHRVATRQGLSGRQWRMLRKDLMRTIKRQRAEALAQTPPPDDQTN